MNEVKGTSTVSSVEYRRRDGKNYIVVNNSAWYPADMFTEVTATEDYIYTHSNGGWDFIPRWVGKSG